MFRRHWSGLPKDARFPSNLKSLGYYVNDEDEIRSIANPTDYFRFEINKNPRINDRQRFEFNNELEKIIHKRLLALGLRKVPLPLDTPRTEPHVPVFMSSDLESRSRVIVLFGEPLQDLGVLAGRVANGPGGIDKGSMVSVVRKLQGQASAGDSTSPGIFIANPGQLYWWAEGNRPLTATGSSGIPLPSLVHLGKRLSDENKVHGHTTAEEHVASVFGMLKAVLSEAVKIDIVAIGQSCELITMFLGAQENWNTWKRHLGAMVLLGSVYPVDQISNDELKAYLAKRARAYILSSEPLEMPLAPPSGNQNARIPALGCPCYSSSEPYYTETILIAALDSVADYLQAVALKPDYENEIILVTEHSENPEEPQGSWEDVPEEHRPVIATVDQDAMTEQVKQLKRWRQYVKTGEAPDSDSDDDSN